MFYRSLLLICIVFVFCGCESETEKFNQAKEKKTVAAYKKYLKEYPNGKFAKEAEQTIEQMFFERCTIRQNYQAYLQKYPNGKFAEQARQKINEFLEQEYRQKFVKVQNDAEQIERMPHPTIETVHL